VACYVVVGCHRSGTSLVAQLLSGMGVCMLFEDTRQADRWNADGYFEDLEFVSLNEALLHLAGGSWLVPPPAGRIWDVADSLQDVIRSAVDKRRGMHKWGFKDPRTALTVHCLWPFLAEADPHLVHVVRAREAVVGSLLRRSQEWADVTRAAICAGEVPEEAEAILAVATGGAEAWGELVDEYARRIAALEAFAGQVGAPWLRVEYERLTDATTARAQVQALRDYVGQGSVEVALRAIQYRS
jgi:hypothetical protein